MKGGRASRHHDLFGEAGKKFEEIAKRSPTFVRYHMTHCGHCIAMKGEWDKLVKDINKDKHMDLELVNVEQSALDYVPDHLKKDIVGFPTLVSYAKGGVDKMEYQGERTAKSMKDWLKEVRSGKLSKPTGNDNKEDSRMYFGNSYGGGSRRNRKHSRRNRRTSKSKTSKRGGKRRRAATRKRRVF